MRRAERIQAIVDWFGENFEDPAHHTPYDGREGGYQYVWGGPHSAEEVIAEAFGGIASQRDISTAIAEVEANGLDWAPNEGRLYDENDGGPFDEAGDEIFAWPAPDLKERAQTLERSLDELEEAVREWRSTRPLIGHNKPPSAISDDLTPDDVFGVETSIAIVRQELASEHPKPENALAAGSTLRSTGNKIKLLAMGAATLFVGGMIEAAGQDAYAKLAIKLDHVADAIAAWVAALPPF